MHAAIVSKRELLQYLGTKHADPPGSIEDWSTKKPLRKKRGGIALIWGSGSAPAEQLPKVWVVDDGDIDDLLAWCSTYLSEYRPITSFFRILTRREYKLFIQQVDTLKAERFSSVFAALAISEACLHTARSGEDLDKLSLNACLNTLSFALSRSLIAGYSQSVIPNVNKAWQKARVITGQRELNLPFSELLDPWIACSGLMDPEFALSDPSEGLSSRGFEFVEVSREFEDLQRLSDSTLQRIGTSIIGFESIQAVLRGPREARVQLFELAMVELLSHKQKRDRTGGLLLGYIANQVGPGTLEHFALLDPCARSIPSAYLWYGLFAGLTNGNQVAEYSTGLGRWVLRELSRGLDIFERPAYDISLRELKILAGGSPSAVDFRSASPGYLDIELIPFVCTRVRWTRDKVLVEGNTESDNLDIRMKLDYVFAIVDHLKMDVENLAHELQQLDGRGSQSRGRKKQPRKK